MKINVAGHDVRKREAKNGEQYIISNLPLQAHPVKMTDRLLRWAVEKPDGVFLGQRDQNGQWVRLNYAQTLQKVQAIAQFLIDIGLTVEKPIAILSGNSIEHGLLALAALHIGVPYSPISPAYSTKSTDFSKLKHCIDLLSPGLIFVQDVQVYQAALKAAGSDIRILAVNNAMEGHDHFDKILDTLVSAAVHAAYTKIQADTIAKILFTSGSTGLPKGVINTHGNITTNWQQITQTFPFISYEEESITLIDWLPWNHVFGGNHNFGIALYNGGTLYIDEGNPTPEGMLTTLKNLGDVSPTVYLNVPKGFEELVNHLKADKVLCSKFFRRLKLLFYAGASMPQHVWDGLEQLAYDTVGKRLLIATGLGMTEASPSCIFNTITGRGSGELGVPVPGLELKLVPDGDKLEARFKGGNITPGYWRNPDATAKAFDEEGFYKTGDALKMIDEHDVNKGLRFDGRISEDFKLMTGTWVNVGVLRASLTQAANGLIQDVVITGHDRDFIGAIIFPEVNYCCALAGLPQSAMISEVVRHPKVRAALQTIINDLGKKQTGSSTFIQRAVFADFALSIDKGEVTDKGSINQRSILKHRADTVALLYRDDLPEDVIVFQNETYA